MSKWICKCKAINHVMASSCHACGDEMLPIRNSFSDNSAQEENKTVERVCSLQTHIMKVAMDLLYKDAHHWSKRPCQTCRAITELFGFDFGCIRKAKESQ